MNFERDWSIGLCSTFGDGETDRQTQKYFLKRLFYGSDIESKTIKKIEVEFL